MRRVGGGDGRDRPKGEDRVKHIIDAELFCACRKCEEAVQDILRMESMLCRGAKSVLTQRRKRIKRESRLPYYRAYYAERAS